MHSLAILSSISLALTSVTQASPLNRRTESRQTTAPSKFYLETQVIAGGNDTGTNKGGLYLFSYHTGAGLGIAAAEHSDPNGSYFYLNGTELLWTYTENTIGPWPVAIEYGPYQCTYNVLWPSSMFRLLTCCSFQPNLDLYRWRGTYARFLGERNRPTV